MKKRNIRKAFVAGALAASVVFGSAATATTALAAPDDEITVDRGDSSTTKKTTPTVTPGAGDSKPQNAKDRSNGASKAYLAHFTDKDTGVLMFGTGPYKGDAEIRGMISVPLMKVTNLDSETTKSLAMGSITLMGQKVSNASDLSGKVGEAKSQIVKKLDSLSKNQGQKILGGESPTGLTQEEVIKISPLVSDYITAYKTLSSYDGKSDEDIKATMLGAADGREWKAAYVISATTTMLIDGKLPQDRTMTVPMIAGKPDPEWVEKTLVEQGLKEEKKDKKSSDSTSADSSTKDSTDTSTDKKDESKSDDKSNVDGAKTMDAIKAEVENVVNAADKDGNKLSVNMKGVEGGVKGAGFKLGGSDNAYAASTVKVIVAAAVADKLKGEDKIKVDSDVIVDGSSGVNGKEGEYTVDELTKWMIQKSDNTATNALMKAVVGDEDWKSSKFDKINEYSKKAGSDKGFIVKNKMMSTQDSKINSEDAVTFLTKLQEGKVVEKEKSDKIIDLMKGQEVKTKIAGIAPEGKFATKTGENKGVSHEIGYLFTDGGTIAFAVVGTGDNEDGLNKGIQEIGKKVFETKPVEKEKKEESKDDKSSDDKSKDKDSDKSSDDKSKSEDAGDK